MSIIYKQSTKLLYPDLSYNVNGILFNTFKEIGPGYQEKHVQRAVAQGFEKAKLNYKEQVMVVMQVHGKVVGRYFLDFVVDEKVVLELKVAERFFRKDYDQVKYYLLTSGIQLGLLARFGRSGVKVERVLRPSEVS